MKFKVNKGTDTYKLIEEYAAKRRIAHNQAMELARELGATGYAHAKYNDIAGFVFQSITPKEGWKYAGTRKNGPTIHLPLQKKANKWIFDKMRAIPFPSTDELNKALNWTGIQIVSGMQMIDGLGHVFTPGADFALVDAHPESDYEPLPDMIEITVSEYNRLKAKLVEETKSDD